MTRKLKGGLIAGGVIAALAGGGAAIAVATGDDGNGNPITGRELDRAKAAALEVTGGGRVTGSEVADEEGYYEVEVRRDDGSQVDVHLGRDFKVLDATADGHGDGSKGD